MSTFSSKTMKSGHISRRRVLKNSALMALLAPVLRQRDAYGAPAPRRIICIYEPNGPISMTGPATGTSETSFAFSDWWKPLERHRDSGIFMSHMAITGAGVVRGDGHGLGGQIFSGAGVSGSYANAGPTIDYLIAKHLAAERRAGVVPSVVWGLSRGATGEAFHNASADVPPETDPSRAWSAIFSKVMAPDGTATLDPKQALIMARERSVLDFLNQDCLALKDMLGSEGLRFLDDHCSRLRSMEQNLSNPENVGTSAVCTKPANPGTKNWDSPETYDVKMAAFIDLMAMTLACELSHVIAFQFSGQAGRQRLPASYNVPSSGKQVGDPGGGPQHHAWTHNPGGYDPSSNKTRSLKIFQTYYSTQVALLVDRLKKTMDASGKPLLDSTLVVWASELGGKNGGGAYHPTGVNPVVLFGGGQGTFKTGRYIQGKCPTNAPDQAVNARSNTGFVEAGRDHARVLISAMQYMGVKIDRPLGATGVSAPFMALYG
jgi:hypothetical protein